MLKWLLGRTVAAESRERRDGGEAPAARAGVSVHAAGAVATVGPSAGRGGVSGLGPAAPALPGDGLSWAAIVLAGASAGDVVFASGGRLGVPEGVALLSDGVGAERPPEPPRIPAETLAGVAVTGVTGARVLARTDARAVLRLGPPPAARWAVEGLRAVAVLRGRLTLIDGEEGSEVRAGEVAFVARPSATLHVLAGNDAAVAVAFATPDLSLRLE